MNTDKSTSLPACDEWLVELPKAEVTDVDFVPDIPLELLPIVQAGERIWPCGRLRLTQPQT
jgi:hypothetical protein